jgi:signal transduction histidine kinase
VKISEDRFLGFVVDITERKQSEAKIREKDLEFRKLSLHVPDLIFQFTKRVDGSYFVPIASEGIINIFGCLPEDVVDSFDAIAKVIHPDDSERVINEIELSASNLTPFTCEFRVILPEKGIQWIYSNSTPEKLQDGSITWYGFNTNITIRKNAEELLILQNIDLERQYEEYVQLNEVLKETNLDLEKAKLKAEESDRLKTAFLQNISHEVRTPLNGIIGFSNLLQLDNLSQIEIKDFTKNIQQSGKRLAETVDNILEMSKLETNQIMPNIKPIKINTFMNKLYDNFIDDAGIKGLIFKLNKDSNDNDFQFSSDETILNIILTNLLKNAIKFTYIGSVIFGYEINNGKIMFFVKDSGIGIPENKKNQIFRKFAQANLSITRGYEGAGLGLPISQGLVELLGGNIDIKSEVDKGSTFSFTLVNLNKL